MAESRYIIARNVVLERALDYLRCVISAFNAQQRIECSVMLVALADALGVDKKKPASYTLVYVAKRWLDRLGVDVAEHDTLEDALKRKYSDDIEVDMFVKALIVASSVIAAAATLPFAQRDLLQVW